MLKLAVIGAGYWGKNLVRNFSMAKNAELAYVCDENTQTLQKMKVLYPDSKHTSNYNDVLNDPDVQAVVIATPASDHYNIVKLSLLSQKHVFVEKPMCLDPSDAMELVALAKQLGKILMVGHLMEYHPAVSWIKDHLHELGNIFYIYSQRLNLGIVRKDENAWWSLAPHDISMILYLLGQMPIRVAATGASYLRPKIDDVVFATLWFADGKMVQIHVSWLDPHKIRKLTIVGEQKMITFDDMEATEKIKIFDKGAQKDFLDAHYGDYITIRLGDIYLPRVDMTEPLKLECDHFVSSCLLEKAPLSDGLDGLRVVQILHAGQKSIEQGGKPVDI